MAAFAANKKETDMADEARSRLGRGLASLIGDVGQEAAKPERTRPQRRVPIEFLRANPLNPRRVFSESDLADLTASIKERGVIQPIVVRPVHGEQNAFEIVAGERRWRASQRAGLHDVPVVVVDVTDTEALEIAIIENVQRADLNPLEEARGYQQLMTDFKRGQEEVAKIVGKSRSHVANMMRLLKLPPKVLAYIESGELSASHARALIGVDDPETAAKLIVEQGLNVRQTEALAHDKGVPMRAKKAASAKSPKDPDMVALEKRVGDALGLAVSVDHKASGGGTLTIKYRDLDQLDDVLRRLEQGNS